MSNWSDPATWASMYGGEDCGVCRRGTPEDAVAELEVSWLGMGEDAPMRGYCFLMFKRHAVELHDLSPEEGAAFMRDIQRVSRVVHSVVKPIKMNYEVHGNTVPHLHMHFFPRYVGDPFEGGPINPRGVTGPVYASGEFKEIRRRIAEALVCVGVR